MINNFKMGYFTMENGNMLPLFSIETKTIPGVAQWPVAWWPGEQQSRHVGEMQYFARAINTK